MTTFTAMVDTILSELHGYVRDQEQSTHLTGDITSNSLNISVADASRVPGIGRAEIGDELVWVDSVDQNTNTLIVPPYGRGFDTTTAATHTAGTRVILNPLFPRTVVKRAVNATIQDAAGDLFVVGTTQFVKNGVQLTYPLPAGTFAVLQASWQVVGPTKVWKRIREWTLDQEDGSVGTSITLYDPITSGRMIQVVYAHFASLLTNDTDDFAAITGLPATAEDVVRYGAAARLLSYLDSSRVDTQAAEPTMQGNAVPVGAASQVSKQMYAMFRQRLSEERARLFGTYPSYSHYSR